MQTIARMAPEPIQKIEILGVPFSCGTVEALVESALNGHGLVTAPSAPCLAIAARDPDYTKQLAASQLAIADSGTMVLMWRLICWHTPLRRVSGLAFLESFLDAPRIREPNALFLVDPTADASRRNREFLNERGIDVRPENQYVAPIYQASAVEDEVLLKQLIDRKPRYILINLGGGIQERLGAWLQDKLPEESEAFRQPTIICTGAAIAFLTGEQSRIPQWADRIYLGWAIRCFDKPSLYLPRYFQSVPVLYYTLKDAVKSKFK